MIGVFFRTGEGDQTDALGVMVAARERPTWIEAITAAAGVPVKPD